MVAATYDPDRDDAVPWGALIVLGSASFASSAALRFIDPLLPKIADAFSTTPGAASITVTAYAVAYGGFQLITGPLGDRYGKVKVVAIGAILSGLATLVSALATGLDQLALLRLLAGLTGAAIIPNCLAFIGDNVRVDQRQAVLARYMVSMSTGALCGQAIGGIVADLFGWQSVFVMVGTFLVGAGTILLVQLRTNPVLARMPPPPPGGVRAAIGRMTELAGNPHARLVIIAVTVEAALFYGAFTFVGAHLRSQYGLSYTLIGAMTALTSVGALVYAIIAPGLLARFDQRQLVTGAALFMPLCFGLLAASPPLAVVALAIVAGGIGFVLLHNALQTNATQLNPSARGAAISAFAFCFFFGQTVGVALAGQIFDHAGGSILFVGAAVLLPVLVLWFRAGLAAKQTFG